VGLMLETIIEWLQLYGFASSVGDRRGQQSIC
jgi:hypothetical protein